MDGQSMSSISNFWIYNTMLIENQWNKVGTGFLVSKADNPGGKVGRIFLVTNKHVLNRNPKLRNKASKITLHLNVRNKDNNIVGNEALFPTVIDNEKSYREHPLPDVDVLAFDITRLLANNPNIVSKQLPLDKIATKSVIEKEEIRMGEEILVMGYPSGLKHRTTNFPLLRKGIISTRIGEELQDNFRGSDGIIRKRLLPGFFIDGAVIPGSSGSPVFLNPLRTKFIGENITIQTGDLLLGIIAETIYAPISIPRKVTYGFAGLGLAFDGETIIETIDLFE
jgi:V8-like Glu-specific endopeptidase